MIYLSDPTDSEELRYCLRYGKDPWEEAQSILDDVEPDSDMGRLYLTAHKRAGYHSGLHGWPAGRDVLFESLASATAPGGLLDRLADAVL